MSTAFPPSFKGLAWANLAAQSAEQICLTAVPMFAVLMLGAGPGEIGLLAMLQSLPFLLMSIPLGVLADRSSRKRLMVLAEALRLLSLLGLCVVAATGQSSLALLAVLGFIGATGTVGFSVAAPALVPALVPREALGAANGRLELARSAAFAAGPALAGALVSWAGASAAFVLATMLSSSALMLLMRVPEPPRAAAPPRHVMHELAEGARFVWQSDLLRPMVLCGVVWNVAWFVLQAAYVPYAVKTLGLSADAVGITLATYGAGMVVGALAAPRLLKRIAFGHAILLGPLMSVLASLVMAATLLVPSGALAALSFFLFGAGPILWTITSTTLRQTIVPGAMLGRVGSMFLAVNAGARPLGAALGGLVGAQWGAQTCLVVSAIGFALQAVVIVLSAVRKLQSLPATPPTAAGAA